MKCRDLYFLQELAGEGKIKFINITQIGRCAVAEATNGFCYMQIAEENNKRFNQGFFSYLGRCTQIEVQLPRGYEILSSDGKIIGNYQYAEPFDINTGEQGEFTATFNREELLDFLKRYLMDWKRTNADKYMLVFHRDIDCWRARGYIGDKVKIKEFPPVGNISDKSFRFAVNPHTFKRIVRWFEGANITLYFKHGNYECRNSIFMRDYNKLAVLMPIARRKK